MIDQHFFEQCRAAQYVKNYMQYIVLQTDVS